MKIETFKVQSESGKIRSARRIFQRLNAPQSLDGPPTVLYGAPRVELDDGRPLNPGPNGTFLAFDTREVFTPV